MAVQIDTRSHRTAISSKVALAALSIFGTTPTVAAPFHTRVHLWFSAFIPDKHPGKPDYLLVTQKGTHVIPAPDFLGPYSGTCFAGDDRGFSDNPMASSRITIELYVDIDGENMTIEPNPRLSPGLSHNVDCKTGLDLKPTKRAPTEPIQVHNVMKGAFDSVFFMEAASANPYYPSVKVPGLNMYLGISPDIDFKMSIRYNFFRRSLDLNGSVGTFPSFEAYYAINGAAAKPIYRLPPDGASTAWSLPDFSLGINTRNVSDVIPLS